jgi:phosphatidylglycerol:prolipoprotein diacylglycerol transferase
MLGAPIPYFVAPEKTIDLPFFDWSLPLQVFGPIAVIGVMVGLKFGNRYAKAKDIDSFIAYDQNFWTLVFAFIVSHWISVIFYFPDQIVDDPWVLAKILSGLSSVGGFFGAFIGMNWFLRRTSQPVLVFADMNIFSLVIGLTIGRFGCALVHDHPGRVVSADTFLAVGPWPCRCPTGRSLPECCSEVAQVFRYDLGLIECLVLVLMSIFVYLIYDWRKAKPGRLVGLVSICYGMIRFGLDFLRAAERGHGLSTTDTRYAGLTTAQYISLAILGAGIWLLFLRKPRPEDLNWAKESDRLAREKAQATDASTPTLP